MNVLVIDTDAVGLAFCWRCVQSGHKVRWYVKEDPHLDKDIGKGFGVERIDNWVASVKWADLIFPTSNDAFMSRLEFFRKNGAMVFGPSKDSADLEIDRAKGMKFLTENGIDVPPYETFTDLKEAEDHVMKTKERYVFKLMGDGPDTKRSYCAKSPADLVDFLRDMQEKKVEIKGEIMLQTFIEGVEMGVSRWMGLDGYVGMWNENFEHKKMMPGDCGPTTGEMGTVMAYTKNSKLGDEVMKPIEKPLMEMGHFGDTDLNCIIDKKGKPWPLEFTNRPGWPAFNIMLSQHRGDPVKWMLDAMRGKDSLQASEKVHTGIVLAIPDFPHSKFTKAEVSDHTIYGVNEENEKKIQPQYIKKSKKPDMEGEEIVEKDMWVSAGDYLAIIVGSGRSVSASMHDANKVMDDLYVHDMMYRDDIGEGLKDKIPDLHKHGYATAFNY